MTVGDRQLGAFQFSDGVGVVLAVRPGGNGISVGQRVLTTILPKWISGPLTVQKRESGLGGPAADGVLAERILLDATAVVPAPGLSGPSLAKSAGFWDPSITIHQ